MTVYLHELRQTRLMTVIWGAAITAFIVMCIVLYPEMSGQMEEMSKAFASMGSFTQAFGMDRLDFGEFSGFYGVECGNILGIGGAFFAAFLGITLLSKEEKEHTADFLLTHPVTRARVVGAKLAAAVTQLIAMNAVIFLCTVLSVLAIGETPDWSIIALLHLAYFLLQLEICLVCFGISAFLRRGGTGIGLGLAALLYFLNIVANLTDKAKFLKYITPFGYAESADIVESGGLDAVYVAIGAALAAVAVAAAYFKYCKKDIHG